MSDPRTSIAQFVGRLGRATSRWLLRRRFRSPVSETPTSQLPPPTRSEVLTSMNAESPYMFYLDLAVGRSVTSDDPAFSVAFGRRSKVVYRDTLNEIVLGASFDGPIIDTDGLTRQVLSLPVLGGFDTYALLVLQRIGAAAAWRSQGTVFRGILGDRLARCLGGGHTVSRQGSVAGSIGTSMVGSVVGSGSSFADVRVRPAHVRVRPWVPSSTCLLRLAVPVPSGGVPA